jgi:hypothetical protein
MTDMASRPVPLDTLYAELDALARGRAHGEAWAAHEAVLDRLAENRRAAEANGWTSCALERDGRMGRLRAWGVPPSGGERRIIPDWPAEAR